MIIDTVPILIGLIFIIAGLAGFLKRHDIEIGQKCAQAGVSLGIVGFAILLMSFHPSPNNGLAIDSSSVGEKAVHGAISAQLETSVESANVANAETTQSTDTSSVKLASNKHHGSAPLPEYAGKTYRLKSKVNEMYLYEDGLGDRLLTEEEVNNRKYIYFTFEHQPDDKSFRIKSEGSGEYMHASLTAEKLLTVSAHNQEDFSRFYIEKFADGSIRLIVKAGQLRVGLDQKEGLIIINEIEHGGIDHSRIMLELVEIDRG